MRPRPNASDGGEKKGEPKVGVEAAPWGPFGMPRPRVTMGNCLV